MTHIEIVKRLIGPINPKGNAAIDPDRLENLKALCNLTEGLIHEISHVTRSKESYEASVKEAGKYAESFLQGLFEYCPNAPKPPLRTLADSPQHCNEILDLFPDSYGTWDKTFQGVTFQPYNGYYLHVHNDGKISYGSVAGAEMFPLSICAFILEHYQIETP